MRTVIALGMTRIEVKLPFGFGFWLCDQKRVNKKYSSTELRYYMPIQHREKKKWSLSFDYFPFLDRLFAAVELKEGRSD